MLRMSMDVWGQNGRELSFTSITLLRCKIEAISVFLILVAGAFLSGAAVSSVRADTSERVLWPTNSDILVGDHNITTKYVRAEPGEIVTVNWKSGSVPINCYCILTMTTGVPALNWSSDLTPNGASFRGAWAGSSSPASSWLRTGGYDVVSIDFAKQNGGAGWGTGNNITVNVTVTQDNYTFAPDTNKLEGEIAALQGQVDAINISSLQTAISELQTAQAGLNTQITSLRDTIALLQTALSQNGENDTNATTTLQGQITALSETLTTLESVSAQNNETLMTEMTLLVEKVDSINTTSTNTTTYVTSTDLIENPYNDTPIWNEVTKLKSTPPLINNNYNNTTALFPTTYQNKTIVQKSETDMALLIVVSSITGGICGIITGMIYTYRNKKRFGG